MKSGAKQLIRELRKLPRIQIDNKGTNTDAKEASYERENEKSID
jgi:hypothetical protein